MTSSDRSHQALYRRWRAQTFGEMVGQDAVVETLRNAVRTGKVAHALLFVGPRGTGKTSTARIVAKALNCTDLHDGEPCDRCPSCVAIREGRALDVIEMDAASHNKVDDIREFLPRVATGPSDLRRKVFIIDEVQRIKEGWDLLLKTLEEPPDHVAFIFCTTDASAVRPAVLSRVQRFDFRPLTVPQIEGKLRRVLVAEGRDAEPEAVTLVARLAAGGMRDAESMLDQLLTSGPAQLSAAHVRELLGVVETETVNAFVAALVEGDALAGIGILDALDDRGRDTRAFLNQVVDQMRTALVERLVSRSAGPGADGRDPVSEGLASAARRLAAIDPTRPGPGGLRFQLEIALLSTSGPPAPSTDGPRANPPPVAPQRHEQTPARPVARRPEPSLPDSLPAVAPPAPPPLPAPAATGTPAPIPARPAASPPSPASASAGDGLAELQRQWPEIVAYISRNPPAKPLITVCRPIAVEGNVVTLGFPESHAFLRDVAERRRPVLEEGVAHFLGRAVSVRCVASNLDRPTAPSVDEGAARLLAEARRIFADDLADAEEVG